MESVSNMVIWVTYHDDKQIEEYNLKEDGNFRLFKGNDITVEGDNINNLNKFYSELVTFYYVWKNNIESKYVGFCHYRRMFQNILEPDANQCLVMEILYNNNVLSHYKWAHNYQDLFDMIDILNEKYGNNNKYSKYLLESNIFIPFCCFLMNYTDFKKLCDWLFPILFAWDNKNCLNMEAEKYMDKAKQDFRYDNIDYQCRAIAFLAERLISCYIVTEMKPFCVKTL